MFPYTGLMPKQVLATESRSDDANLKLLVANVMMENRESEAFLDIVRNYDPDVILTVETDKWWEEALRTLGDKYPYTLKNPLDNTYGMLLHSRLEMIDPEIRFILKDSIPSMHMQLVLPSGDRVFMHFIHPDPPNPKYATETTERDAELLIVGREAEKHDKPTIVAGDFNDVAWSRTSNLFQKASGLLDPRIGRGMFNTFNANNPPLPALAARSRLFLRSFQARAHGERTRLRIGSFSHFHRTESGVRSTSRTERTGYEPDGRKAGR